MRGMQVAEALRCRGWNCVAVAGPSLWALRGVRDSIIVCVKSQPHRHHALHAKRNILILDALDHDPRLLRDCEGACAAVLFGSEATRDVYLAQYPAGRAFVFYHHADPHILPHHPVMQAKLVYVGETVNSIGSKGGLRGVALLDFKKADWRERLRAYNAHFSGRLDVTKSVVKLANCSASHAVFIGGKEPGAVELLGDDYPYFLTSLQPQDVQCCLDRYNASFGSPLWHEARARVIAQQQRLSLAASVAQYERLFAELT
ncbi:MAG: hypothetical protein SF187_17320 [Deltaproteobacteria bacterium]|nr:hypothetical protein [Deltaproteobacteria bacterium]